MNHRMLSQLPDDLPTRLGPPRRLVKAALMVVAAGQAQADARRPRPPPTLDARRCADYDPARRVADESRLEGELAVAMARGVTINQVHRAIEPLYRGGRVIASYLLQDAAAVVAALRPEPVLMFSARAGAQQAWWEAPPAASLSSYQTYLAQR